MLGRVMAMMAAIALISAVGLAGCSGSKKSSATPTLDAAGAGSATASADSSATATAQGALSEEIKAITSKLSAGTFKGTYTLTTTDSSEDALTDGQMVLYKQGPNRIRFDVGGKQGGQEVQIVFIEDGDTSLFCLKDPGGIAGVAGVPSDEGVCVNSASDDESPAGSLSQVFSDLENDDVTVLEKTSRMIAGVPADCYRAKDNKTDEISTTCFSADGAVLYANDDSSEITATQIAGAVSDSDFAPPYPVTDIPGLGSSG